METLLSWSFWFNLRPPAMLPLFNYLFIVFLFLLLIATVASFLMKTKNKFYKSFWKNFYGFSLSNLIIGLLLFFFNYQRAPFLSARFWLFAWGALMIIWLTFLILEFKKIPQKKQKLSEEEAFKKYLP